MRPGAACWLSITDARNAVAPATPPAPLGITDGRDDEAHGDPGEVDQAEWPRERETNGHCLGPPKRHGLIACGHRGVQSFVDVVQNPLAIDRFSRVIT